METRSIAFFDAKKYDKIIFEKENERYGYGITYFPEKLDSATASVAARYPIVCAFVNDVIDEHVIDILAKGETKIIALRSAGYNNVDFKAAYGRIPIVHVPRYSPHAVAEHAVALMLTLNRKTHKAYNRTREGNFSIEGLMGFDMYGKTAGVIGTGAIGKVLISLLRGFGMNVLAYDPSPNETYAADEGFRYVDLITLYRESDIISLHCPLTPSTHYIIGKKSLSEMKDGVMIINTGRGALVDTKSLIEGLKSGKVGSAGLDVYEEESEYFFGDFSAAVIADDILARLMTFPNVLITSHQAFFTDEALHAIAKTTLENISEFLEGAPLRHEICYSCGKECSKKTQGRCF